MAWVRNYPPLTKMPSAKKQAQRARRIERAFVVKHGVSSIKHLSMVMKGTNEVFEDCSCYACVKYFYEKKTLAEKLRTMKRN